MFLRIILVVLLLLFFVLPPASGQASASGWAAVGQIGGPVEALVVQGTVAYLGVGQRVLTLDISDPAHIRQIGASPVLPASVRGLAVSPSSAAFAGRYVYVAAGEAGLIILDVTDPARPLRVGGYDSPGHALGIAVAGPILYLADGPAGLRLVDVTDATHAHEVSAVFPTSYATAVALQGHYAYVAAAGSGLQVADVSNCRWPVETTAVATPGYARDVIVKDNRVFVAADTAGVQVFDIQMPSAPVLLGGRATSGPALGLAAAGQDIFVAAGYAGIDTLAAGVGGQLTATGNYPIPYGATGRVAASDNRAYVVDRFGGLHVLDVRNPSAPHLLGRFLQFPVTHGLALAGDRAYIAAGPSGLVIVDIADPSAPRLLGRAALSDSAAAYAPSVEVAGNYAYVCAYGELKVADVRDPSRPAWVGSASSAGACQGLLIQNSIAYIANEHGLKLLSLADPTQPTDLGFIQLEQSWASAATNATAVRGDLAYVTHGWDGLEVVNVADPRHPVLVGHLAGPGVFYWDITIAGSLAFIADRGFGLRVLDLADPRHPVELATLELPGGGEAVVVAAGHAYVANMTGVHVVDVTDPRHPTTVTSYATLTTAEDVAVRAGRIFLAAMSSGLLVLESTGAAVAASAAPFPETTIPHLAAHLTLSASSGAAPQPATGLDGAAVAAARSAGRPVATNCVVRSRADLGANTLRACLERLGPATTVTFDPAVFPAAAPVTIELKSALPHITQADVTLDASGAGVILDGHALTGWASGLQIEGDRVTVRGLTIANFPDACIALSSADNVIGGNRSLHQGNTLGGCGTGLALSGAGAHDNRIVGNHIGVDRAGAAALGNQASGIFLMQDTSHNMIGGPSPGDRNVVSGNGRCGIIIQYRSHHNQVFGNYAGTDASGTRPLGNGFAGICIEVGGYANLLAGNVASANTVTGIHIGDWGSNFNVVTGNHIGADASGSTLLANGQNAIFLGYQGASFNRIGGARPEERNLICGQQMGLAVYGPGAADNLILGNWFGLTADGAALGDFFNPLYLSRDTQTVVGGTGAGEGNWIRGGHLSGMVIDAIGAALLGNTVEDGRAGTGGQNIWLRGARAAVVQGNTLKERGKGFGLTVTGGDANTLRRNAIYDNDRGGIRLEQAGNRLLPAPVLTTTDAGALGTACPGCTVEFFFDAADQGRYFAGEARAGTDGAFALPPICPAPAGHLTATATDAASNTSVFSAAQPVVWDCAAPAPLPSLDAIHPTQARALGPTLALTLRGAGFTPQSHALWDEEALPTTWVSATELRAVIPSRRLVREHTAQIKVLNSAPGGGCIGQVAVRRDGAPPALSAPDPPGLIGQHAADAYSTAAARFG